MFNVEQDIGEHYEEYRNFLINTLKKRFRDSLSIEDIEDLVSNTFMQSIRKQSSFEYRGDGSFRSWLYTLAIHLTLNQLVSIQKREIFSQEDEGVFHEMNNLHHSTQNEMMDQFYEEVIKFIDNSIPNLDKRLLLGYANGYTYDELAEIFEVHVGTVKSKIHHARKKLLKYFKYTLS